MTTKDKQKEEDFKNGFLEMAKALSELQDRAVETYRPLVNDICNRNAKEDEVEHLLTWMFDFVGNEKCCYFSRKYAALIYTRTLKWWDSILWSTVKSTIERA